MISAPVSRSLRMGPHTHPRRCNSCLFTGTFVMIREPIGLPAVCRQGRNSSPGLYGSVAEWFKAVLIKLGGTPQVRILSLPFKEFSSVIEQRTPNPRTVV